jgi:hypothetical protein
MTDRAPVSGASAETRSGGVVHAAAFFVQPLPI